ncbi:MAG: peptide ABC transporter substrate-binding protein [Campylobacteraceae bacterium]|nr:peptide ABC transporter substrate-binding protein [Campylobacteraceae bacterium]
MQYLIKILTILFTLGLFLSFNLSASTLNLSMTSSPSRLNPLLSSDSASSEITQWIFNGLLKYDKDGKIALDLASSYSFENNTKLIIKLRQDVLWHDGEKFTAKDVVFTYNAIINPKIFVTFSSNYEKVQSVKALDSYTIEVIYKEPYFKALEAWLVGILPHHIYKNEKNMMTSVYNKTPIGTNAYKLKSFQSGKDIKLIAFDDYFNGRAKIDEINYTFLPDPTTSFLMLKQRKLDVGKLTPLQIDRQIKKKFTKNYSIIEQPSLSYTYLGFNLNHKKFKNKKIREALSLAINRQELVDILFIGHGQVNNGPFLKGSFVYPEDTKDIVQNIQQAKQLLSEAGYDQSNPFTFEVETNTGNETRINAAQILQYQLQKAGIHMKIRVMEWRAFLNTVVHPRNFEAVLLGWSLALMPDAYPLWHSNSRKIGSFNLTGYSNKEVDALIEKGSITIDKVEFSKIYKKIFKMITADLPYLFLYTSNDITVVNKRIKNVQPAFLGIMHNQKDWIKP